MDFLSTVPDIFFHHVGAIDFPIMILYNIQIVAKMETDGVEFLAFLLYPQFEMVIPHDGRGTHHV